MVRDEESTSPVGFLPNQDPSPTPSKTPKLQLSKQIPVWDRTVFLILLKASRSSETRKAEKPAPPGRASGDVTTNLYNIPDGTLGQEEDLG